MKFYLYRIWAMFLTAFGNLRISRVFPWIYYDTTDFKVKGEQIADIMKILKPGYIILRGYDSYCDGKFIDDPLKYSHGAIYLGNNEILHAIAEGVERINVIDFCQCDRIAIFRPKRYIRQGIRNALDYEGCEYDFSFENGNSAIYCFELCALSYPKLDIKPVNIKKFIFIKKCVYLAKSFFKSKDLECIYQYNPKFNIDYITTRS